MNEYRQRECQKLLWSVVTRDFDTPRVDITELTSEDLSYVVNVVQIQIS